MKLINESTITQRNFYLYVIIGDPNNLGQTICLIMHGLTFCKLFNFLTSHHIYHFNISDFIVPVELSEVP